MKGILICADDYGLHPDVDCAIVDLAKAGRLSAASVLVDAHGLRERASWLDGLDLDVGLHLNLTERVGDLSDGDVEPSLGKLIVACYARKIAPAWVSHAVARQFDAFERLFGRLPDYVDGHQHVHQLPVVRTALIAELQKRCDAVQRRPWIRSTRSTRGLLATGVRQWFKSLVIESLGARAMERLALSGGFACNRGFAGVYDFTRPAMPYGDLMQRWLDTCEMGSLIMAHPSRGLLSGDPVGQARLTEFQVLASERFMLWLAERSLALVRPDQVLDPVSVNDSSRP
ncbi:ChbG/HpnK family deacetylase [Orrella marina]|uniref:ChbG/HpnK family deacetylase n=1 Tax=Orrella marina TaxID=2163011 RepID=UPI00131F0C4F|nr:ChbG/HpnK family deacetylase [Orrella marina]